MANYIVEVLAKLVNGKTNIQKELDSIKGLTAKIDDVTINKKQVEQKIKNSVPKNTKTTITITTDKAKSRIADLNNYLTKNAAITKDAKNQIHAWISELEKGTVTKTELSKINAEFKTLDSQMRKMGKLGNTVFGGMAEQAKKFANWVSVTSIVMGAIRSLGKMKDSVYEIDTAMTNLYKVTDETDIRYNKFLTSACDNAKRLGQSVSDLVEQTANWAKLGFNLGDAAKLAEVSSIYANVGEVDNTTAVSDLVTTIKAFNIEADKSIHIVDSLNKLSNEFATSAKGLGEGLSNSASAMAFGGMTLEKTLALLTGGSEITQEAGELGNALKVGQMRIQGMKGALEELGEEYDNIESVSKIQTHLLNLTKGQVNIMNDADPTKFKDYYDILQDVSKVFDKLDKTKQADLLETMFGKMRGNQGAALIQAFQSGQIQKAYEAAMNSQGSAMKEQERWLESLDAKTKQFDASFQKLSTHVLDSDLLKGLVDTGTEFINILDTIVEKIGIIPTAIAGVGIGAGLKNFSEIKQLPKHIIQLIENQEALALINNKQISTWGALKNVMASTGKSMLKSILSPTNLVIAGVASVIAVIYKTSEAIDKVKDKAEELGSSFNENKSDIENYKKEIEDLYKVINNSGSSIDEVANARKELMSVQDALIEKFGKEKNILDLVTDAVNGQSDAFDKLTSAKWQSTKNDFNKSDVWNDFANWQEGYSDNIERMASEMETAFANIEMSTSDYFSGKYDSLINMLEKQGWNYTPSLEMFTKGNSVENLYEEIVKIQTIVGEDAPDKFLKSLTDDANKFGSTLTKYEDMWNSYILNDKIFANEKLAETFDKINESYSKYNDLKSSGDSDAIVNSMFAETLKAALDDENISESVKDYFADMYPTLTREVEKWEFKAKIIPNFDTHGLNGLSQNDILEALQTDDFQKGEQTFNSLLNLAREYEIVTGSNSEQVKQLLDLLSEWGILQGKVNDIANEYTDDGVLSSKNIEEVSSSTKELRTSVSSLNDAFSEQNENGSISMDTMLSLVDAGYATALSFDAETGACKINTDAMIELAKAKISVQIADLEALKVNISDKLKEEGIAAREASNGFMALAIAKTAEQTSSISQYNSITAQIKALQDLSLNMNKVASGSYNKSSSSSKSKTDYTKVLDRELDALDAKMDLGLISFKDYINKRKNLIQSYYNSGKIEADKYYDYLEKLNEKQISGMDKAISAVVKSIDKRITALESSKKAISDNYNNQIKAIEDEKDALEKANKARQESIDLQKKEYELKRAQNQKVAVLTENGVQYKADTSSIKEAQKALDESKYNLNISAMDSKIDSLKSQLESATASIDSQIEALEAYKDKWSEISSVYETQQAELYAAELLGANWEQDVQNMRLDVLTNFTNQYISLQQAQANAAVEAAKIIKDAQNGETSSRSVGSSVSSKSIKPSSTAEWYEIATNKKGSGKYAQNNNIKMMLYGKGTKSAKRGINLVGEEDPEIVLNKNGTASLISSPTLYKFNGGETVINGSDTNRIFGNGFSGTMMDKITSLYDSSKFNFGNFKVPDYNFSKNENDKTNSIVIQKGAITLNGVNDVNTLGTAIVNQLPIIMTQKLNSLK